MSLQGKVLRVNEVEERTAYRDAVSEAIRNIMADHGVTLLEISERVDVSLGTISNAFNKKNDLSPTYLNRLGRAFGPHALDPYLRLCGGRVVPREPETGGDILPMLALSTHAIASARSPTSPGGIAETLRERLGYLPEMRRLHREMGALIATIENEREAA